MDIHDELRRVAEYCSEFEAQGPGGSLTARGPVPERVCTNCLHFDGGRCIIYQKSKDRPMTK